MSPALITLHNHIRTAGSGVIATEVSEGVWAIRCAPHVLQPAAIDLYPHEDGTVSVDASTSRAE